MGSRGPAPDPNAIRRDRPSDQATWTTLPAKREGPPPAWPLEDIDLDERHAHFWSALWVLPQAVMWEKNQQHVEVALHVETLVDAAFGYWLEGGENRDGTRRIYRGNPAPMRALALKQQESLGLTTPAMNRLRWRIGPAPAKEAPKRDRRSTIDKARFTVIPGEAAG